MLRRFIPFATLLMASLAWQACDRPEVSSPTSASSPTQIVIALKPDKNPDAMLEEQNQLSAYLSSQLGLPVRIIIPLAGSVIEEGLANGTIDLAYVSGGTMLRVSDQKSAELLLAGEIDGKTTYASYWVCLKEKPYTSVGDLRGRPVAFSGKTSTSGALIPQWDLVKKGLLAARENPEAFFGPGNVWYGSGYVSAIERVLAGEAEAAAVSYYVLDRDKHLTPGQRSRLKKICEQGPVPTHALAIRSSLNAATRARLKDALLSLNEPEQTPLRDKVFTSKLVSVDAATHLAVLREAFDLTLAP
jgi:phosphonate transport system substrate-binding protein